MKIHEDFVPSLHMKIICYWHDMQGRLNKPSHMQTSHTYKRENSINIRCPIFCNALPTKIKNVDITVENVKIQWINTL